MLTQNRFSNFHHGEKEISRALSEAPPPLLNSENAAKRDKSYLSTVP